MTTSALSVLQISSAQPAPNKHVPGEPGSFSSRGDDLYHLTVGEVGARLRLGKTKVFELCRSGDLEVRKFGRATRISRRSVVAYIEGAARNPSDR